MAVYSKLLLSAGGGIISTQQQADQEKNTATVLIGLGGTGIDCLRTIKTQVRSRLKPDDPEAVVPEYSHIRFLGVDTAEKMKGDIVEEEKEKKPDSRAALEDTEFFSIANPGIKKAFDNERALQTRDELKWLRWKEIETPDLGKAGAGGIRQIGRFMMMDKSDLFMTRVSQEIDAAKSGLSTPTVNVHIFSGLSGGTGAGCFLDVCYMVRSIAEKVGGVTIFGYFFLPDVNLSRIPASDTKTRAYIPKNGYASMQELDYCMQLQYNGGSFVQEYKGHKKIKWETSPVDMCHLVCATNEAGDVIPNAYDYAMNVTAEYVMDFLTCSTEEFGLSEQLSNFRRKVAIGDGEKMLGSYLGYCVIGAACASIPLREINTYLASELFEKFSAIGHNVPTKEDVEKLAIGAFAKDAQFVTQIYDSMYRELRTQAEGSYAQYPDDWRFVRNYGNSEMVKHYTNQTASYKNRVQANAKSLTTEGNEQSLLGRVNARLADIMRDIDRGPIYAYRMISAAESHNLLNIIDGLKADNESRWNQEAAQSKLRNDDYEHARADFEQRRKRSLADNDAKRFNDYEYYMMLLEQHKLNLWVYEKMEAILKTFREQIVNVTASYYIKLARVMSALIQTFKENRNALKSEKIMQEKGAFAIPMMTIAELKPSLDEEIENINVPGMMDEFMRGLLTNSSEWLNEDENKISRFVTKFFVETAFGNFASKTITSFLKDKYRLDNDELLSQKIYQEWMKLLTAKASPLFYFDDSIWGSSNTSKLAFLSVPNTSAPIMAAAKKMFDVDDTWKTKTSALTDRIYVMCSACALPLSAYSRCKEYEIACFSTEEVGSHYYEGRDVPGMKFNDWRKLPSLTPQSVLLIDEAPLKLKKIVEGAQELYEEAEKAGIFNDDNVICRISEEAKAVIQEKISACKMLTERISRAEEEENTEAAIAELEAAVQVPLTETEFKIKMDGYRESEETIKSVRKDHFVSAPAYQMMVREILDEVQTVRDEAEQAKKALLNKMQKITEGGQEIGNYLDAVFTGVIALEGRRVTYTQINYGIVKEFVLSMRSDEFPRNGIPIYQGFLSYQALSAETKEEIKKIVDDRYNNADDQEIKVTGEKLKEVFSDNRVNAWSQMAADYSDRADIMEFLIKMKKRFHIFCMESL